MRLPPSVGLTTDDYAYDGRNVKVRHLVVASKTAGSTPLERSGRSCTSLGFNHLFCLSRFLSSRKATPASIRGGLTAVRTACWLKGLPPITQTKLPAADFVAFQVPAKPLDLRGTRLSLKSRRAMRSDWSERSDRARLLGRPSAQFDSRGRYGSSARRGCA